MIIVIVIIFIIIIIYCHHPASDNLSAVSSRWFQHHWADCQISIRRTLKQDIDDDDNVNVDVDDDIDVDDDVDGDDDGDDDLLLKSLAIVLFVLVTTRLQERVEIQQSGWRRSHHRCHRHQHHQHHCQYQHHHQH